MVSTGYIWKYICILNVYVYEQHQLVNKRGHKFEGVWEVWKESKQVINVLIII